MTNTTIEREAKLFEAGSYPDRGVEITEKDLDRIVEGTAEAPVRIEHTDTPFDGAIGFLKGVYRKGRQLFGKLCFTHAAWELIKAANARRLSIALRKDKTGIAEVSLVREPRIADAAVFSEEETVQMTGAELALETEFSSSDDEAAELRKQLAAKDADALIDALKRAGKLVPASEPFARAILLAGEANVITFADETVPVADIFRRLIESQPKVIEFSELAPSDPAPAAEPEVFAKLGVTSSQVEKYRGR